MQNTKSRLEDRRSMAAIEALWSASSRMARKVVSTNSGDGLIHVEFRIWLDMVNAK